MSGSPPPTPPAIPPDREGKSTFVHRALIFTGRLGRIAPIRLWPLWIALLFLNIWPWRAYPFAASVAAAGFLAADGLLLALLPRRGRSWGPVTPPLLALALVRLALTWLIAALWPTPAGLGLLILAQLLLSAVAYYATWIEPFRVMITSQALTLPGWHTSRPLRLLHISDIHFEGASPREAEMLARGRALRPDLIVITGDYLNLSSVYDPATQAGIHALLAELQAPLGVYAITGSPPVDVPEIVPSIFADLHLHWLDDAAIRLTWEGQPLWLLGVRCTRDEQRDGAALARLLADVPPGEPTLLLYHTPDLMPEATAGGVTLYLAGHTHGGQLRLPFYGALATSSKWGKRYEMGRFSAGATTLYVSRGLGMEGLGAPRARLLSPPELILWTLEGTS